MFEQLLLFSGTMLAAIVGGLLGAGLGAAVGGWLGSLLTRRRRGVNEGWALEHLIRGGLVGVLPGLIAGGLTGFRWLVLWLQGG